MSYDLYVLSQRRPEEDGVREFFARYPEASVEGSLADEHHLLADAQSTEGWALTVDAPYLFDPEEAPFDPYDQVLQEHVTPPPVWETFIAVPYFRAEKGVAVAYALALHLALECEGQVWDPQTETLAEDVSAVARAVDSYRGTGEDVQEVGLEDSAEK